MKDSLSSIEKSKLFTLWKHAVSNKDIETVKQIIDSGYDINQNKRGFNALHHAMFWNYSEITDLLLAQPNIDVNVKGDDSNTILGKLAYRGGTIEMIDKLLNHSGLDVNKQNDFGTTALMIAAKNEKYYVAKKLLLRSDIDVTIKNNYGHAFRNYTIGQDFIDLTSNKNFLKDYDLQKGIIVNGRFDIIIFFYQRGIFNEEIKNEYRHLFTGCDLNLI